MGRFTKARGEISEMSTTSEPLPASTQHGNSLPEPGGILHPYTFLVPTALYLLLVFCVLMAALRLTHGRLVYALDDTYIHMAIAKNLATHGVFGVTSHEFASASSSIVWPFLLAVLFKVLGPAVSVPLVAQIVIGIALLWVSADILKKAGVTSSAYACCVLCALVLALPMVTMTFVAMEHLLHALATLLFASIALNYLYARHDSRPPKILAVSLSAAALVSVRYEGAFLVAAAALLFVVEKKIAKAVVVSVSGAMPILLFGLYSKAHGGFFLPNSLLLKRHALNSGTILRLLTLFRDSPDVYVLVVAALILLAWDTNANRRNCGGLKLFLRAAPPDACGIWLVLSLRSLPGRLWRCHDTGRCLGNRRQTTAPRLVRRRDPDIGLAAASPRTRIHVQNPACDGRYLSPANSDG
jgi:hypothetical protein